jgi:PAS domain S-box-containing protein
LLEHQLLVINDSYKDPRSNEFKIHAKQNCGSGSLLIVPIISDGRLQGFLWIENAGNIKKWEYEEQSFAVSLGEMLAKQIGTVQKKKVERKLEQSEKVFRALVDHSLDLVCIIDKNGILTYQSPSFENVLGFSPNELLGKNAFEFIHPEDFKILKIRFLRLFSQSGLEDSFIYRARHRKGHWVYVEALANNMLKEKEINGIVVNIRDISERMEFQDQLQEQEQYYRTLIEKSLELTVVRDEKGIVTYVSPSVELVFGLNEEDLLGKSDVVQTFKEDLEQFQEDWQYLLEHPEKHIKIDQRIILPDGKVRHVEGMARNLLNVKPVNGIVMNFRDVSSRKNAENALIESQMRLEGIISSALDAIITVDSNHNIVLFNDAAEKMFKQNAYEVFGKPMELLIPKEARKQHKNNIKAFQGSATDQQKMGSSKRQLFGLKSDGALFPIDASISKQTIEDEIFFTAVIRDITEQLKSEQVLKEYNKTLEGEVKVRTRLINRKNNELNNTLEELRNTQEQLVESEKMASLGLTAGIAHEINNPINFVTSTISPLKRDFNTIQKIVSSSNGNGSTKSLSDQSKEIKFLFGEITQLLNGIEEGAKRTKNIVLGLRNFSRLDEESFKKADLQEGLDSTLMLLNSKLRGQIDIEKKYGGIPLVECLPGKINQVFMNILSNAIQAIKGKGKISISTSYKKDFVFISISDSGHGMSKEVQKRIFEPFYTTKDVGVGTGLGLSISYGIIDKHGGTIEVESKSRKGTTFVISLPVSQL